MVVASGTHSSTHALGYTCRRVDVPVEDASVAMKESLVALHCVYREASTQQDTPPRLTHAKELSVPGPSSERRIRPQEAWLLSPQDFVPFPQYPLLHPRALPLDVVDGDHFLLLLLLLLLLALLLPPRLRPFRTLTCPEAFLSRAPLVGGRTDELTRGRPASP